LVVPLHKEELKTLIRQYAAGPLPEWEENYLNYHAARFLDTLTLLGPGSGQRLLDVGAFPGHLTVAAHYLGYQVDGLTGRAESGPSLQMAADRLGRFDIPLVLADVESEPFPYPDTTFDVVLATEIIEHLHFNPYRLLRESFRVLKPGGRILITTPNISSLQNIMRLIRGRNIHPHIYGRFYETFSSILSGRHLREFTSYDLAYLLEGQNKEMYRFEEVQVHYSKCLDPIFSQPHLAAWFDRFWPRFRSTLMVEAGRPREMTLIHPEETRPVAGFYPVEEQGADMDGIARVLTTPFRWTQGTAQMQLPASDAPYQIFFLNVVRMIPESLPPAEWTVTIKDRAITSFSLLPDRTFTTVRILLTPDLAEAGRFPLSLSGPTWKPIDHPQANDYEFSTHDDRNLGIAVGWDGFLREDCPDRSALEKAAQRESRLLEKYEPFDEDVHWRKKHHGFDDRWSHLQMLYLLQADFKPLVRMGQGDWRQLGPGWYFLEKWERSPVRWISRRAVAYLGARPGQNRLRLRVYTGDPRLGERTSGSLELAFSPDRSSFLPFCEIPFDQQAGLWTDLRVGFPQRISSPGIMRLIVKTDQSRSAARLLPGSTDTRELCMGVKGMTLEQA
jgi:SAM-dependent methyltransferase